MTFVRQASVGILALFGIMWMGAAVMPSNVYQALSLLCMRVADGFSHPDTLAVAILVNVVVLAAITLIAALIQAIKTQRVVSALLTSELDPMPVALRSALQRVGISPAATVVQSDKLVALCYGFIRPRLLFSTALVETMEPEELEAVVRHELAHAQKLDPLRNLIARSLSTALFLFPLSRGLAHAYMCQREVRADGEAVSQMNGQVLPLASALQRTLRTRGTFDSASLAIGGLSATDVRIDRLLGLDTSPGALITRPGWMQTAAFVVAFVLLACVLLGSAHAASGINPCMAC